MRLYKKNNTYFLIPDVIINKRMAALRWEKGRFAINLISEMFKSEEVNRHEYLFDNSKTTNVIWCIHRSMKNIVKNENYVGSSTKTTVLYSIKEFEETFEDILRKFKAEFLTIKEEINENL